MRETVAVWWETVKTFRPLDQERLLASLSFCPGILRAQLANLGGFAAARQPVYFLWSLSAEAKKVGMMNHCSHVMIKELRCQRRERTMARCVAAPS